MLPAAASPVIEAFSNERKSEAFAPVCRHHEFKVVAVAALASFTFRVLSPSEPVEDAPSNFQSAYTTGASAVPSACSAAIA